MLSTSASQGGASWKGSCLGCDESSQTEEAGTSLGVELLALPGSACLQNEKASAPLERDPPLACRAEYFHRKAPFPVGIEQCWHFLTALTSCLMDEAVLEPLGSFED